MQINIVVKANSGIESVKKGTRSYKTLAITYEKDGKEETKKLVDFNNKDAFEAATALSPGQVARVTIEKQGDYWQWTAVEVLGSADVAAKAAPAGRTSSTYETAEERAKKQVYIVRQSSISNALSYYAMVGGKVKPDVVLALASEFEEYVFNGLNQAEEPQEVE